MVAPARIVPASAGPAGHRPGPGRGGLGQPAGVGARQSGRRRHRGQGRARRSARQGRRRSRTCRFRRCGPSPRGGIELIADGCQCPRPIADAVQPRLRQEPAGRRPAANAAIRSSRSTRSFPATRSPSRPDRQTSRQSCRMRVSEEYARAIPRRGAPDCRRQAQRERDRRLQEANQRQRKLIVEDA